jgi:hypothetical protein
VEVCFLDLSPVFAFPPTRHGDHRGVGSNRPGPSSYDPVNSSLPTMWHAWFSSPQPLSAEHCRRGVWSATVPTHTAGAHVDLSGSFLHPAYCCGALPRIGPALCTPHGSAGGSPSIGRSDDQWSRRYTFLCSGQAPSPQLGVMRGHGRKVTPWNHPG